jgi:uncharacterized heparinase superfamily protein
LEIETMPKEKSPIAAQARQLADELDRALRAVLENGDDIMKNPAKLLFLTMQALILARHAAAILADSQ